MQLTIFIYLIITVIIFYFLKKHKSNKNNNFIYFLGLINMKSTTINQNFFGILAWIKKYLVI